MTVVNSGFCVTYWVYYSPKLRKTTTKTVNPKGSQSWTFIGKTDAEASILWPPNAKSQLGRPWCWESLRAGEGGDRGWDGWVASPTQWTWVYVNSRRWWRKDREAWGPAVHGVAKSQTWLSNCLNNNNPKLREKTKAKQKTSQDQSVL